MSEQIPKSERAGRQHFDELTAAEKSAAVRRLSAEGLGDYTVAAATGLSVEAVRELLAPVRP